MTCFTLTLPRLNYVVQDGKKLEEDVVHNDFNREMLFYRQAQAAVLEAIPRLQSMQVCIQDLFVPSKIFVQ